MAFARTKALLTRISANRAHLNNETIVRDQPRAGRNISLEWTPEDLLYIHANIATSGTTEAGLKQMIVEVTTRLTPLNPYANGYKHKDTYGGTNDYDDPHRRYYGDAAYVNIHHNFQLTDKDNFNFSVKNFDPSTPEAVSYMSIPQVMGIDGNTIRLWATRKKDIAYNEKLWLPTYTYAKRVSGGVVDGDILYISSGGDEGLGTFQAIETTTVGFFNLIHCNGLLQSWTNLQNVTLYLSDGSPIVFEIQSVINEYDGTKVGHHVDAVDRAIWNASIGYSVVIEEIV